MGISECDRFARDLPCPDGGRRAYLIPKLLACDSRRLCDAVTI